MSAQHGLKARVCGYPVKKLLVGYARILHYGRMFQKKSKHTEKPALGRPGIFHGVQYFLKDRKKHVYAPLFSGKILQKPFFETFRSLAEPNFIVRKEVSVEPIRIQLNETYRAAYS